MSTSNTQCEHPSCAGCHKREYNLTYCPLCNVSFCEACAAEHRHVCTDCGGTGVDAGSLHQPEPCQSCDGSKLGESLVEDLSNRRALAFHQKQMEVTK